MLIKTQKSRFQYDLAGPEAAPVVCCVHALGADHGLWAEQLPALLSKGFRVFRPDLRGHGGSLPTAGSYTMDGLADDIAAILAGLNIERVHYVGTSLGGIVGQAFAIRHGEKLHSLFLSDTLPAAPPGDLWAQRAKIIEQKNTVAPVVEPTMSRWFTDNLKATRPQRWQEIHDTMMATEPLGFIGCVGALQNFDFTGAHASIATPTLVVCGSDDTGTPPEVNRIIAAGIPRARYLEIAGARHCPNVEFAEQYNSLLLDWLHTQ